jgi:SAM-dependent methyltransferase
MHDAAYQFVSRVVEKDPPKKRDVVEFGSLIVNTSVRPLFKGAKSYIGVDARPGPGVDVRARAEQYDAPASADVVVCCETLEHARDPQGIIASAYRTLRVGGQLILTAAGPERQPHSMDGHQRVPRHEHYANITPDDLESWLKDAGFVRVKVTHNQDAGDVYAVAHKPKAATVVAAATTDEEGPHDG